jgi:HK97 gp10 family phage protein
VEPLKVEVSANAPYASALEFGTSKMAERPYMRPAAAKARPQVAELVKAAVTKIIRGGKVVP